MPVRFFVSPVWRILLGLGVWMLLGFVFLESLQTFVSWWRASAAPFGLREAVALFLLLLIMGLYLRTVSIFRPSCTACQSGGDHHDHPSPGP